MNNITDKEKYFRDMSADEDKEYEESKEWREYRNQYKDEHPWNQKDFI